MVRVKFEVKDGYEIRGFMIRLYPTQAEEEYLIGLQKSMRPVWNWMVKGSDEHNRAVQSYAVREGLVGKRPSAPCYYGLEPEASAALKKSHQGLIKDWFNSVKEKTKNIDSCKPRKFKELLEHHEHKYDYGLFERVRSWYDPDKVLPIPTSHMWQSMAKNFFQKGGVGSRPKTYKKRDGEMAIGVKSGMCFALGKFGARSSNPEFYNCRISFSKVKIKGRLPGKSPGGRVLEGVSITKQADGWYASVKVEMPTRALPAAAPGTVIGIDVGLDNIAAFSDGTLVANSRDKEFADKIAHLQKVASQLHHHNGDGVQADICNLQNRIARLHQKAQRQTMHTLYNMVVKPLAMVETIKMEKLISKIGQMSGSRKVSVMRLTYKLLTERYGDRVREVRCEYTSQDCSNPLCGHRDKESWAYSNGSWGKCVKCGFAEHRDINAARNIASRPSISNTV